ncbi:hypothetical protein NE857_12750 [Nocardiopsis exhalans]|uniref:SRPBCC family protein n=1 Tax=Nocardiopsis exhalans TaxID=163604 RepID=A0ABY5DDI5_9ACTN|nr:hypothetical protein [Nocardiopsis exhalans]USY22397.1 hypothetical protein NE857_12750 [Nocardiopsis exhalans]
MRVTDVFEGVHPGFEEALWSRLPVDPVVRVDSGRSGGDLVVDVELAPGVDPRQVLVLHESGALVLLRSTDRAVLCRIALSAPVGRPSLRRTAHGLTVTAPLAGPAPVAVSPGLRQVSRAGRLRTALGGLVARVRGLLARSRTTGASS